MNAKMRSLAICCVTLTFALAQGCGDGKNNPPSGASNTPATPTKVTMGQPTPSSQPATAPPPIVTIPGPQAPKPTEVRPTTVPATQPQTPVGSPTVPAIPTESKVATFAGLRAPKPATWLWRPVTRQFVVAEYTVPGRNGADQATITVSQAGGNMDSNIARWKSQFRSSAGDPVEPTLDTIEAAGMKITLVEIAGEYAGMSGSYTPDQLFITAVVPTEPQQTFIKFVGPSKTVEANRKEFRAMIEGLERAEPEK